MAGTPKRLKCEAELLKRLADGESLVGICRDKHMPDRSSVEHWQDDDEAFNSAIMRAREAGMFVRADRALDKAKSATDPALGRLAWDAERWYIGKLSNAFSDNKERQHKVTLGLTDEERAWLTPKAS